MTKELNEDSGFKVSIKTLIAIGAAMATVIGMWFMLQADIAEAKTLPEPPAAEVTRMEQYSTGNTPPPLQYEALCCRYLWLI